MDFEGLQDDGRHKRGTGANLLKKGADPGDLQRVGEAG